MPRAGFVWFWYLLSWTILLTGIRFDSWPLVAASAMPYFVWFALLRVSKRLDN